MTDVTLLPLYCMFLYVYIICSAMTTVHTVSEIRRPNYSSVQPSWKCSITTCKNNKLPSETAIHVTAFGDNG